MGIMDSLIEGVTRSDCDIPKMDNVRLAKLQAANLQRATAADLGVHVDVKEGGDVQEAERLIDIINKYANGFLPVGACPNCDLRHGFSWGICYGEGHCRCGYPGRAMHQLGDDVGTLSGLVLWYHPEELQPKNDKP